jgi:hypothetical protein
VDRRLAAAVGNNAEWCDLVCRASGIPTEMTATMWAALRDSPALYPDAVTLSADATEADLLNVVVPGRGRSVKDSFAVLDLDDAGFEVLFEARWMYRSPASPGDASGWAVVQSEAELIGWQRAAGDSVNVPLEALRHPSVRVFAAPGQAGAIANRTGEVVGVSNVFGDGAESATTLAALASAIATEFPSLPIVGYDRGTSLRAALRSGFEDVGPLRVWLGR